MKTIATFLFACLGILSSSLSAQNALAFDGNNDYISTTFTGISGSNARTVEAWIKTTSTTIQNVIVDWGTQVQGGRFTMNVLQGNLRVEINGGGVNSTVPVADGNWHHVAVSYTISGQLYCLYIDGQLNTCGTIPVALNTIGGAPVQIGRRVDQVRNFNGSIDEVRVWSVTRTAAQIAAHWNTEFCTFPQGLQAYYKFNQGIPGGVNTGQSTLMDEINGFNGTMFNFALSGTTSNWVAGPNLAGQSASTFADSSCGSYLSPSGAFTWTTSGTYQDTLMGGNGCDSVLTINLTIHPGFLDSMVVNTCDSFISPGGNVHSATGIYRDSLQTQFGCDSVFVIDLTVNTVDTSVTATPTTLMSNAVGATYTWLVCPGQVPIPGATSASFTPLQSGSYAVSVTQNGCTAVSSCYAINLVGIADHPQAWNFHLLPNPSRGEVRLAFPDAQPRRVSLLNSLGQVMAQFATEAGEVILPPAPAGLYFVRVDQGDQSKVKRLLLQP